MSNTVMEISAIAVAINALNEQHWKERNKLEMENAQLRMALQDLIRWATPVSPNDCSSARFDALTKARDLLKYGAR